MCPVFAEYSGVAGKWGRSGAEKAGLFAVAGGGSRQHTNRLGSRLHLSPLRHESSRCRWPQAARPAVRKLYHQIFPCNGAHGAHNRPDATPWTKSALPYGICRSYTVRSNLHTNAARGSIILFAQPRHISDMIPGNRNPTINGILNPRINGTISPAINGTINPRINGTLNPRINGAISPAINGSINPAINGSRNYRINGSLNPAINGSLNPSINGTLNPNINPNIPGQFVWSVDGGGSGFTVPAPDGCILYYDSGGRFAAILVPNGASGLNIFDDATTWIGYALPNGGGHYNWFDTDGGWTHFTT